MRNYPRPTDNIALQTAMCTRAFGDSITSRPVRVFLMDLLSMVPYYTGHLCLGLMQVERIEVKLGSITYGHDRCFFKRTGLRNQPGLLDVAHRLPNTAAPVRRALKIVECLLNMVALTFRFLLWKPDIIHVQFIPLVDYALPFEMWFLKLVRAAFGIKLVYTVHNILPHDTGGRLRVIYSRVYKLFDGFICHDLRAKTRLVNEFQVSPDRVSVIPHGPLFKPERTTALDKVRARLGFRTDACVVLWQGIVRPYKGFSFLLKAWKMACDAGLKGILVIVGTGDKDLLKAIEDEVSSLRVQPSVRLMFRFVSVEELANFYEAADVLVYPYSETTTSGALITGIGYGKTIVASALPAFELLLHHEDNALLVRYGDIEALAAALVRLASDAELRLRLAERLRETQADAPRWVDIAQQTVRCYLALLSSTSALERPINYYCDATDHPK